MQLLFYVSCGQLGAGLFELSDGRFQKIEAGVLAPWCQGYGYLLVERTLADFLEAAEIERVRFEAAIVFDPSANEEDRSLVRFASASSSRQIRSTICRWMEIGC